MFEKYRIAIEVDKMKENNILYVGIMYQDYFIAPCGIKELEAIIKKSNHCDKDIEKLEITMTDLLDKYLKSQNTMSDKISNLRERLSRRKQLYDSVADLLKDINK